MRRAGWAPAAALAAFAAVFLYRALVDSNVAFLPPLPGAAWIRLAAPSEPGMRDPGDEVVRFRRLFSLERGQDGADLSICALRLGNVWLDGASVWAPPFDLGAWKKVRTVRLPPLSPGPHELRVVVLNRNGPAALWARSAALGLLSAPDWEASKDGRLWAPAALAAVPPLPEVSLRFPTPARALMAQLPLLAPLFALAFWASLSRLPDPARARTFLLAAWGGLAVNNIRALPALVGFDVPAHLDYVVYVARTGTLPLANEGWQAFQAPLYYLLCAPLYLAFSRLWPAGTAERLLRVVPLLCGAAQVELAYRCMRQVFRDKDLQCVGLVVGGLLPMNLYLSQSVGNEPLAGCLCAAVIGLALAAFRALSAGRPPGKLVPALGLTLGLALLAKASAWLLAAPLLLLPAYALRVRPRKARGIALGTAATAGLALSVCGWYYLRNWIVFGKPLILGSWDPATGLAWWQDPGYRTLAQFTRFGSSLTHPVYSGFRGIWDALFSTLWLDGYLSGVARFEARPPWNYGAMLSGAWLGCLPSAAIALGAWRALRRPEAALRDGRLFALACLATYTAALAWLYLKLPIYSTAKATYTVGLIPCYATLAASGLEPLLKTRLSRALVCAGLACWAAESYLAYFVVS